MKKLLYIAALASLGISAPVFAHQPAKKLDVVQRGAHGQVTKVKLDGKVYAVCSKTVTDMCVNPRQIGLNEGNWPLNYWPGKPASDIGHPLPVKPPTRAG